MRRAVLLSLCFGIIIAHVLAGPASSVAQPAATTEQAGADEKPQPPRLILDGVFITGEETYALINNQIVRENDTIKDATIRQIRPGEVDIDFRGEVITLKTKEKRKVLKQTEEEKERAKQELLSKKLSAFFQPLISRFKSLSSTQDAKSALAFVSGFLSIILAFFLITYIYVCSCLFLIAKKTGTPARWRAWVPIANLFLMCDIASISYWWLLLILTGAVPLLGIFAQAGLVIFLWNRIALARGKPGWLGFLMIIPLAGFFITGYLAFSK